MPDETRKHWTDDEDLLARFVLGQLDAGEASSLEQHLGECARCAEAVRSERLIAAGLKRAGREELKHRLARRLGQPRTYEFNWYQAAGIAAAIVLLVTVAVRYDWFVRSIDQQAELREKSDKIAQLKQEAPAPQTVPAPPSTDAAKSGVSGRAAKSITGEDAEVKRMESDEKRILSLEKGKSPEPVPLLLGKGERSQEKKEQPALMAVAANAGELWTQGIIIHPVVKRFADQAANLAADAERISVVTMTKKEGVDTTAVRVTQRPVSALPAAQQVAGRTVGIQTLLRQSPQGLQLTLFSDTLLTPQELSQARLQTVGEDSLVLLVGRKLIGYRTPPGWLLRTK